MRRRGSRRTTVALVAAWATLLAAPGPARADAPKTDVVVMRNGDRLVCEIKDLEQGRLRVKTDGTARSGPRWPNVV